MRIGRREGMKAGFCHYHRYTLTLRQMRLHGCLNKNAEVVGMVFEHEETAAAGNDARLVLSYSFQYFLVANIGMQVLDF